MFYSKSTGGFYVAEIHGDNIPPDAVEITTDEHAALLAGQSAGKLIRADADGRPVAVDPQPLPPNQIIMAQIVALEGTITDRRWREAVLGADNGWLKGVNDQITALRAKLPK